MWLHRLAVAILPIPVTIINRINWLLAKHPTWSKPFPLLGLTLSSSKVRHCLPFNSPIAYSLHSLPFWLPWPLPCGHQAAPEPCSCRVACRAVVQGFLSVLCFWGYMKPLNCVQQRHVKLQPCQSFYWHKVTVAPALQSSYPACSTSQLTFTIFLRRPSAVLSLALCKSSSDLMRKLLGRKPCIARSYLAT